MNNIKADVLTQYIQTNFIHELSGLDAEKNLLYPIIVCTLALEFYGSFLDTKPFRVKAQSKKRFELALGKLMPKEYNKANDKDFLYYQLRCNLAHRMMPGNEIIFRKITGDHLSVNQLGKLQFRTDKYISDFISASHKMIHRIENGNVHLKKIGIEELPSVF